MTPDRAKEIQQSQSEWPYWGNFTKFMTPDEIHEVRAFRDTLSGNTCFADALNRIASA